MKLKQITVKEPVERLAVSIKRSSMELLEAYKAEYAKLYDADIEMSPFVETILKNFIESDKAFMRRFAAAASRKAGEDARLPEPQSLDDAQGQTAAGSTSPGAQDYGHTSFDSTDTATH